MAREYTILVSISINPLHEDSYFVHIEHDNRVPWVVLDILYLSIIM